ncbi:unnamed protein product [Prunus armeniaca]|uniref:Uncharacterized protein n=1 Tax=Prunus armeniaca TaxID=36596 RepID=A0A6J5UEP5_PRUAR|nr:unnamed protein product [Prunus armeniaca]
MRKGGCSRLGGWNGRGRVEGGEGSEGGLDVSLVGFERRDGVDNTVKLGLEVVMVNISGGGTEVLIGDREM